VAEAQAWFQQHHPQAPLTSVSISPGLFRGEEPARNFSPHPDSPWHCKNANRAGDQKALSCAGRIAGKGGMAALTLGNASRARTKAQLYINGFMAVIGRLGSKHVEEPVDAFRANEPSKDDEGPRDERHCVTQQHHQTVSFHHSRAQEHYRPRRHHVAERNRKRQ
jgi:hypothetical protein